MEKNEAHLIFDESDNRSGLPNIISVQSQVLRGCVGNSIAVPTLTGHGLDVLAVPTVILSHTPDNRPVYGGGLPPEWFHGFFQDITDRGLDKNLSAVLTGYLGSTDKAKMLITWLENLVKKAPHLLVIVDPVLGDVDTGFYVDPTLTDWYKDSLGPLSTILTPNLFELESLTGITMNCMDDIIVAAKALLKGRTQWVIVTSALPWLRESEVSVVCVSHKENFCITHERYLGAPKGTGDLFTAELTFGLVNGFPIRDAVTTACDITCKSIKRSLATSSRLLKPITD